MQIFAFSEHRVDDIINSKCLDGILNNYKLTLPQRIVIDLSSEKTQEAVTSVILKKIGWLFPEFKEEELYVGVTNDFYGYTSQRVAEGFIDDRYNMVGFKCDSRELAEKTRDLLGERRFVPEKPGTHITNQSDVIFIAKWTGKCD